MRNTFLNLKIVIIFGVSFLSKGMYAQLGFCQGNSGDPIFTETFGTGTNYGPALPAGTTTYSFIDNWGPQDGQYTIGENTFSFGWNLPSDHTGDTNGKALIVNASFTAGEFYKTTINGLCENTTYEFSSWLINILPSSGCGGNGIPVNVRFEIWDITDTNLLASGNTGDIFGTTSPTWQQYGLVFQTLASQTSVILKMKNNGVGGCGNDLAIDDIVFRSCGDTIAVEDNSSVNSITLCSTETPYSTTITAAPDNVVFSDHFFQWQISNDGINWVDLIGETNEFLSITGVIATSYYRAKVAEYAANLSNDDCITFSDVYEIIVNEAPSAPVLECWETASFNDSSCSWIVTGTQPAAPTGLECWEVATFNTSSCAWEISGSQPAQPTLECWEMATFNNATCVWDITGTQPAVPTGLECWEIPTFNPTICNWEISGTQPIEPTNLECWETTEFNDDSCEWEIIGTQPIDYRDEFMSLCPNEEIELTATSSIVNPYYQWDSGQMLQAISVDNAGTYIVEVTDGCLTEIITFNVTEIEDPIIETVNSNGSSIIITLLNEGDYSYALDGINYQNSNVFSNVQSGLYTIFIRSNACNTIFAQAYFHFFIQKYMTPNDDGKNDYFSLNIAQFFSSTEVSIFDRYGKLLFSAVNSNVNWDGTFNGTELPTSDYWYRIVLDGKAFIGHFTLKR